jgi:predicted transposase/invertase (TIGR01784 family)
MHEKPQKCTFFAEFPFKVRLICRTGKNGGSMKYKVFAPITLDSVFKIVFTKEQCKRSLLFLLNTFLERVLKKPITDVEIIQTVEPGETIGNKVVVFDMQCKDSAGNRFIVEMQVGEQEFFIKRTFFYLCRAVSNLVKKGKMEGRKKKLPYDYNIPVVYTLSFLNFDVDFGEGCDEVVQYLSISNDLHPEVRYDMMHMAYVRLTKFNKSERDCRNTLDRLVFAFKNAHKLKSKPRSFKEEELDIIFESAKISNFKPEELMDYERKMKYYSDSENALAYAKKKGILELAALLESGIPLPEAKRKLGVR